MSVQRYYIVDVAEDVSKVGYSIGVFVANAFYQVSGIEDLKKSMDAYMVSRFSQRLEYFTHEHDKLSVDEKKAFYNDLKNNKQNVNYLYEFVEKARTTTFELHARIYAILSARLVKNGELKYYESALLANISSLNEVDFISLQKALKKNREIPITEKCLWGKDDGASLYELIGIKKFINIGIINEDLAPFVNYGGEMESVSFIKNEYSDEILNILNEIAI